MQIRRIEYITHKKGIPSRHIIFCADDEADQEYNKHRSSVELGDNPNYCDDCQYTNCYPEWRHHVVRCKQKKPIKKGD